MTWTVTTAVISMLLFAGCKNQKTESSNTGGQSIAEPARRDFWPGLWLFTTTAVYPGMPKFTPQAWESQEFQITLGHISTAEGLIQLDIRADETAVYRLGEHAVQLTWKSDANTIRLWPPAEFARLGARNDFPIILHRVEGLLVQAAPERQMNSIAASLQGLATFRRFTQPTQLSIADIQGEWHLDQAATRRLGVETLIAALDASVARGAADDMKLREDLIKQRSESFTPSPRLDSIVIIKDNQLSIASPNAKTRETRQVAISQRADGIFTMELPSREPNAGLMAPLLIQGDALILGPGTPTAMVYRRR
jgi:hypothetical protein